MKSLKEMNELIKQLVEAESVEMEQKKIYVEKSKVVQSIKDEIYKELELQELDSFKSSYGTVYISNKYDVKFPKDGEKKFHLKNYLQEKGVFDLLWSINYQSLNSYYKQEAEAAEERGELLDIPGIDPVVSKTLNFRKG